MSDLLLKMLVVAVATVLVLSLLGNLLLVGSLGGGNSLAASFWLSLLAVLVLVPVAYSFRSSRGMDSLVLKGFLLRLLAICIVALYILPFYAAKQSADAVVYDSQAEAVADQMRAGDWAQIDFRAGSEMVWCVTALLYLPFGPSAAGMTVVSGLLGFVGSLCFVGAAAETLPLKRLRQYAIFVMMLPSLVFWSTLFGKDSWVFLGLGVSALGMAQWLRHQRWSSAVKMLFGLGIVFAFRPYVALAVVLSLVLTALVSRERSAPLSVFKTIPVLVVLAPMMFFMWQSVSRMTGVTEISESSIVGRISEQGVQLKTGGGSEVNTTDIHGGRSFLLHLPEGAVRLLFRPWPWEAKSFFMFVAALDNIVLVVVLVARRRNVVNSLRTIRTQPYPFFCVALTMILTLLFSTTPNLGLSMRQKTQITPFLYFLAFSEDRKKASRRNVVAQGLSGSAWSRPIPGAAAVDLKSSTASRI